MADTASPRDILARVTADGRKVLVPHLAEMLQREGIETVQSKEERRLFWLRAATPEQEAQMWQDEMLQRGITELAPESPEVLDIGLKISKAVYPARWDMLEGEGRTHASEQAQWAWKHAKKGPPAEMASETAGEGQ